MLSTLIMLPFALKTFMSIFEWPYETGFTVFCLQTPEKYMRRYLHNNKGQFSKYHAYAFDGVWVIASVVDRILKQHQNSSSNKLLYEGMFRGDRISAALNDTNFRGVTVLLLFCIYT